VYTIIINPIKQEKQYTLVNPYIIHTQREEMLKYINCFYNLAELPEEGFYYRIRTLQHRCVDLIKNMMAGTKWDAKNFHRKRPWHIPYIPRSLRLLSD
jgi:hypothetical protein